MRYLGRKFGLDGKTEEDKVRVDMILENAMDLRNGFSKLCYDPNFEQLKPSYLQKLETTLTDLSKFLGTRRFFATDSVTFPDFFMYEMLSAHKELAPELIGKFKNLVDFMERVEKLPKIASFLKSSRSPKGSNNKMAVFSAA